MKAKNLVASVAKQSCLSQSTLPCTDPEPSACHSERSEESHLSVQGKLREGERNEPRSKKQRGELENFICAEFVEHDIIFLSELISKMSIDIKCPFCTSRLEQLMVIRRDLKKELAFLKKPVQNNSKPVPDRFRN